MTENKKWMNRLKKCLKDMPEDTELMISLSGRATADVVLMSKGGFNNGIDANGGDSFGADFSRYEIESFTGDRLHPCSENI